MRDWQGVIKFLRCWLSSAGQLGAWNHRPLEALSCPLEKPKLIESLQNTDSRIHISVSWGNYRVLECERNPAMFSQGLSPTCLICCSRDSGVGPSLLCGGEKNEAGQSLCPTQHHCWTWKQDLPLVLTPKLCPLQPARQSPWFIFLFFWTSKLIYCFEFFKSEMWEAPPTPTPW